MFQQRRRGPGLGLILLAAQLFNVGFDRIPPVALSVIGVNVGVYLKLLNQLPRLGKACVSAEYVWDYGDWKRLILASFYHLDDWHLYYNMASFLWKGISLERSLGSAGFLYVLTVFSVLTNIVLVALDVLFANVLGDPSYFYTCAAGFSGVIFALKVLTTYDLPSGVSYVMGMFPVPVRYACWAELLLIQLLVPNASFTGHLAGILVGLMYVKGPLKPLMSAAASTGRYRYSVQLQSLILSGKNILEELLSRELTTMRHVSFIQNLDSLDGYLYSERQSSNFLTNEIQSNSNLLQNESYAAKSIECSNYKQGRTFSFIKQVLNKII